MEKLSEQDIICQMLRRQLHNSINTVHKLQKHINHMEIKSSDKDILMQIFKEGHENTELINLECLDLKELDIS